MYQMIIPSGLSRQRYISGYAALNLRAPEGTSGDWHFLNNFYATSIENVKEVIFVAGDGEGTHVNTNHIYGEYGIYCCLDNLKPEFDFEGDCEIKSVN
jgi:hypothetical protein